MSEPNLDRWAREVVERSKGSIWAGIGFTFALHLIVQAPVFFFLLGAAKSDSGLELAWLPLMYIGLSQLIYVVPAILIFRRRGDTETAKGVTVGAAVTFLLNATCNGLIFFNR